MTTIIKMCHIREARYCASGARVFFKRHELDWNDFLKNGITEKELLVTGDTMAIKVVEAARGK